MKYLLLILAMTLSCVTQAHDKIGFVDTDYIMAYSNEGKRVNARLNAKRDEYNKKLEMQSAEIQKVAADLKTSHSAFLERQYNDMSAAFIADRDAAEVRLAQVFQKESDRLLINLSIVLDQYRKHHGYDIIYTAIAGASFDDDLLITIKVLEYFNKTHP